MRSTRLSRGADDAVASTTQCIALPSNAQLENYAQGILLDGLEAALDELPAGQRAAGSVDDAPRTRYFRLVSFSFSRQTNSIKSPSGISVAVSVLPQAFM